MNIAFFLLPKLEVACVSERATLRQTLEKMEHHRFTAVPILNESGEYVATVTEGDLLWHMKNNPHVTFDNAHQHKLSDVKLRMRVKPVRIDSQIGDLVSLAKVQNFVPVVDDQGKFIGIVRRSHILDYCLETLREPQARSGVAGL